jgi:phage shock protein E
MDEGLGEAACDAHEGPRWVAQASPAPGVPSSWTPILPVALVASSLILLARDAAPQRTYHGLAGRRGSTDTLGMGFAGAAGMMVANTDQDMRREGKEAIPMPTNIDRHGVQRLVVEGAQLVEVLPPKDYEDEHLPGAINIPLKQLDRKTTTILDRNQPVIVYCYDNQ